MQYSKYILKLKMEEDNLNGFSSIFRNTVPVNYMLIAVAQWRSPPEAEFMNVQFRWGFWA